MMDAIFPKRSLVARERDRVPEDYRPKQLRLDGAAQGDDHGTLLDGVGINLDRIEDDIKPNRLQEIATLIRALTYGEMMRLAQDLWRTRPSGALDERSLPMMLHLWSNPTAGAEPPDVKAVVEVMADDEP